MSFSMTSDNSTSEHYILVATCQPYSGPYDISGPFKLPTEPQAVIRTHISKCISLSLSLRDNILYIVYLFISDSWSMQKELNYIYLK